MAGENVSIGWFLNNNWKNGTEHQALSGSRFLAPIIWCYERVFIIKWVDLYVYHIGS
jgi:hypothetical protein